MEAVKERRKQEKRNGFFCCRAELQGRHAGERIQTREDSSDETKGSAMSPPTQSRPLTFIMHQIPPNDVLATTVPMACSS